MNTSSAQSNSTGRFFGSTDESSWTASSSVGWWWGYHTSYIYYNNGTDAEDTGKRLSVGNLHDSAWHHIAIVRPAAANTTMKVYVDGHSAADSVSIVNAQQTMVSSSATFPFNGLPNTATLLV